MYSILMTLLQKLARIPNIVHHRALYNEFRQSCVAVVYIYLNERESASLNITCAKVTELKDIRLYTYPTSDPTVICILAYKANVI